jgi:hypothetical protein
MYSANPGMNTTGKKPRRVKADQPCRTSVNRCERDGDDCIANMTTCVYLGKRVAVAEKEVAYWRGKYELQMKQFPLLRVKP